MVQFSVPVNVVECSTWQHAEIVKGVYCQNSGVVISGTNDELAHDANENLLRECLMLNQTVYIRGSQ